MKSIEIKGSLREVVGKTTSKILRKQEQIPCVIYGNGENVHFHTHENSFKELVYTPNASLVNIDIDGKIYQTVLRDIQFHPVSDKIIHVDFYKVDEKEPVWIKMPVVLEGTSVGVLKGGKLVQKMRKLKVKALASVLPDEIKINISKLAIGKSIKVGDLKYEGIEFLEGGNAVVVLVKSARGAAGAIAEIVEEETSEEAAAE